MYIFKGFDFFPTFSFLFSPLCINSSSEPVSTVQVTATILTPQADLSWCKKSLHLDFGLGSHLKPPFYILCFMLAYTNHVTNFILG